jgi:hypothetical protein
MTKTNDIEQIKQLLASCNTEQRYEIFQILRQEFPIHPIEKELNVTAEIILEAISRANDLTLRGIRGVIAEAAFEIHIVNKLDNWSNLSLDGNYAYDFLLGDIVGNVRVQVKMQRQKEHRPMMANEAYRNLPNTMYVVETQRTRGGQRNGENTRPYRFGEFDILAVSMQPSTGNWNDFMYTVERWLLPALVNPNHLLKFQPVAKDRNDVWTNNFQECVNWFRSGEVKRII